MNRFLLLALTAGLLSPFAAMADLGKADFEKERLHYPTEMKLKTYKEISESDLIEDMFC